ncbi:MAG TPA: hypothetical protein VGK50_06390 [Coriobacteriia bacterium]|jgi:hypothetical protein
MCESGVNQGQMKLSIAQVDQMLGMAQEWLEQLHHLCDHGHEEAASSHLAQVTVMLGEARERLDMATDDLGKGGHDHVKVELV